MDIGGGEGWEGKGVRLILGDEGGRMRRRRGWKMEREGEGGGEESELKRAISEDTLRS